MLVIVLALVLLAVSGPVLFALAKALTAIITGKH